MTSAQLINQTSGIVEYFTDPRIVEAARRAMGRISLDPASSALANQRIQAVLYYTKEIDGLLQPWIGDSVWLNHPFHAGWTACTPECKRKTCEKRGHVYEDIPSNADWIDKLVSEYERKNFAQACCITFAATSEKWFQPLLKFPQCFLSPRTNYYLPDGSVMTGVTKGSVVTYLGTDIPAFHREFEPFGEVKVLFDSAYRNLCYRLLDGMEHVEGCAKCNADDWDLCGGGGREAKDAMRAARKVFL